MIINYDLFLDIVEMSFNYHNGILNQWQRVISTCFLQDKIETGSIKKHKAK